MLLPERIAMLFTIFVLTIFATNISPARLIRRIIWKTPITSNSYRPVAQVIWSWVDIISWILFVWLAFSSVTFLLEKL